MAGNPHRRHLSGSVNAHAQVHRAAIALTFHFVDVPGRAVAVQRTIDPCDAVLGRYAHVLKGVIPQGLPPGRVDFPAGIDLDFVLCQAVYHAQQHRRHHAQQHQPQGGPYFFRHGFPLLPPGRRKRSIMGVNRFMKRMA